MPAAELTAQASDEAVLTVTGTATETADGWTLPVAIVSQDAVDLGREPRLAWFQDGRLVDLTTMDHDGDPYASLAGGGQTLSAEATGDHLWGCGDLADVFDNDAAIGSAPERVAVRPAGTYDVVAVLPTGQGVLLSEPVPLTTTVSAVAPASFREGFADDRLAFGADVTCGMPVTDLPESDARFTVDVVVSPSFEMPHWELPIHVASSGGAGEGEPVSAVLLWVQDGVVIDLGTQDTGYASANEYAAGGPVLSGGSLEDNAVGSAVSTCVPNADGTTFRSYRPAGDYEVIPLVRIGYGDEVPLVLGDPVQVTVGERGRP
ncbi:hypothetical protein L1785_04035 [Antribacter sp. KLBMP9083]|uniref:Uncharacterized protein n=1 Tax=Antribacter soli TaxID=2910976 RepID=A0AA41QCL0_9MICO|nr:hypothetical protein [Antribacter soli]MCF4120141.1 hypothetical protein [Antribacter soli]